MLIKRGWIIDLVYQTIFRRRVTISVVEEGGRRNRRDSFDVVTSFFYQFPYVITKVRSTQTIFSLKQTNQRILFRIMNHMGPLNVNEKTRTFVVCVRVRVWVLLVCIILFTLLNVVSTFILIGPTPVFVFNCIWILNSTHSLYLDRYKDLLPVISSTSIPQHSKCWSHPV